MKTFLFPKVDTAKTPAKTGTYNTADVKVIQNELTQLITEKLGAESNWTDKNDKKYSRSIDVQVFESKTVPGSKAVTINYLGDKVTVNSTKDEMLRDAKYILENTFKYQNVGKVVIYGQQMLEDVYGKSSPDVVLTIGLDKETAGKIEWDNFDVKNFKAVASEYWEHPTFKK